MRLGSIIIQKIKKQLKQWTATTTKEDKDDFVFLLLLLIKMQKVKPSIVSKYYVRLLNGLNEQI